jgi:tRNA(Ile2)-agmatinylcytidine synthase
METTLVEIEGKSRIGSSGTDPAAVFMKGKPSHSVTDFSKRALFDVLSAKQAVGVIRSAGASAAAYGSEVGLVGALAAVGQRLTGDHTYELIAYRAVKNLGTRRRVDEESVKQMDRSTGSMTFNNYDYENQSVLITPHGPDPVLLGIRGENPDIVRAAFRLIKVDEPVERWVVFRTNHGTDAHLNAVSAIHYLKQHRPVAVRGHVIDRPTHSIGGHVFMNLRTGSRVITCAAYEPTGRFRRVIGELGTGDNVTAFGRLRENPVSRLPTINLEKLTVHRLADKVLVRNPTCPRCGRRLKSAGRGQGFRCEMCSLRFPGVAKDTSKELRSITTGVYLPTLKAHRHLTKPLSRYGQEKSWDHRPPAGIWHYP